MDASPSHALGILSLLTVLIAVAFGLVTIGDLSQMEQFVLFGALFVFFTLIVIIYRLMVR